MTRGLSMVLLLPVLWARAEERADTLYGMKINGNLLRGARFGPRVEKHWQVAEKK